jgi:hypothetical protein
LSWSSNESACSSTSGSVKCMTPGPWCVDRCVRVYLIHCGPFVLSIAAFESRAEFPHERPQVKRSGGILALATDLTFSSVLKETWRT